MEKPKLQRYIKKKRHNSDNTRQKEIKQQHSTAVTFTQQTPDEILLALLKNSFVFFLKKNQNTVIDD